MDSPSRRSRRSPCHPTRNLELDPGWPLGWDVAADFPPSTGGKGKFRKWAGIRDCSTVPGADSRIARQGQGESTRDPLHDSELAPDSANGSIPSLIAWTVPKPPGNAATVSLYLDF